VDLRVFILITSLDPLLVYIYNEGYAKIAAHPFEELGLNQNPAIHLTNFAVSGTNKVKNNSPIA
jgi:hypothetical protein